MKRWLPITAVALLLYLGAQIVHPFLNSFAWAAVMVLTSWPIYARLRKHYITSPSLSAMFMTLSVLIVFLLAVVPLAAQLSRELRGIADISPQSAESILFTVREKVGYLPIIGQPLASSLNGRTFSAAEISELMLKYRQQTLSLAASVTKSFFGALAAFFAAFFIMFFLFRDGASIGKQLVAAAYRLGGEPVKELLEIARVTVGAAIFGYVLTAVAQGVLAGIGYALAGAPTPLLFAALTAIISLLPFGTPFVYVPLILYMLFLGDASILTVALLLAWCVGVVSTADNVIRPMVISQATSLSFLLVLIGVLGGILYFGLIGIVLGPVTLALIHSLWIGFVRREAVGAESPKPT